MKKLGGEIASIVTDIKLATSEAASKEEESAEALMTSVQWLIAAMAIGGLALGGLLAWLIGISYSILEGLRLKLDEVL